MLEDLTKFDYLPQVEVYIGEGIVGPILRHARFSHGCSPSSGIPVGSGYGTNKLYVELLPNIFGDDGATQANPSAISRWEKAGRPDPTGGHDLHVNLVYVKATLLLIQEKGVGSLDGWWTEEELTLMTKGLFPWTGFKENYSEIDRISKVIEDLADRDRKIFDDKLKEHLSKIQIMGGKGAKRKLTEYERKHAIESLKNGFFMHGLQDVAVHLFIPGSLRHNMKMAPDADAWRRLKASAYWEMRKGAIANLPTRKEIDDARKKASQQTVRLRTTVEMRRKVTGMSPLEFLYFWEEMSEIFNGKLSEAISLIESLQAYTLGQSTEPEKDPVCLSSEAISKINQLLNKEMSDRKMTEEQFIKYTGLLPVTYHRLREGKLPTDDKGNFVDVDLLADLLYIAVRVDNTGEVSTLLSVDFYLDLLSPYRDCVASHT